MPPPLSSIEAPPCPIDPLADGPTQRRHAVISGTGRTGTTFLVELLTHLGLDTGFTLDQLTTRKDKRSRAGFERDIRKADAPYIVKAPGFCDSAAEVLARSDIAIDHVFIPMRDLDAAAKSRRLVYDAAIAEMSLFRRWLRIMRPQRIHGGLWHTFRGKDQEIVLAQQLYQLLVALSDAAVPVTLLRFPRLVKDPAYLFTKLQPILSDVTEEQFRAAFEATARPDLVHTFNKNDR